jgi:PAS domain S-box-containing protein
MGWLALGVLYSLTYASVAFLLRNQPAVLSWFRAIALLAPPLTGAVVIVRRRQTWSGCQWLFWSTIALGLTMSGIGLTGWATDELLSSRQTWLAWPAVFALFGNVAPLFALLAQPHRGPREPVAATTAIDIAGLAVVTGFLYSFFVTGPDSVGNAGQVSRSLQAVSELQAVVVVAGLIAATITARQSPWRDTYRRLALGAFVSLVTLTLSNLQTGDGDYRGAVVFDFTWILPFAFYPWAASLAPASGAATDSSAASASEELSRPRGWVIFSAVALLPFIDLGLRSIAPSSFPAFRDISTAVTIISVLPLLVARIATERAELQVASGTTRLLAQVIEQAQDLILVLTPDGRCRHANSAFCRAVGYSSEELVAMPPRTLIEQDAVSSEDLRSLIGSGRSWRGTMMRTRKDRTTFPAAAVLTPVVDDHGRVTHIVSVERDISEERRLRAQLIHSERLMAVGQLVAGVAHELNNPLQSVIGMTQLLIGSEAREQVREDLEHVRANGERAATIVRNLLAFARRSALERSVADLGEIARSALALRAYELRGADITVREDYAAELPLIEVNREEIQQVVLNLVLNAEQAIRSTGRCGTIGLSTGRLDDGAIFLDVTDDGPGIPGSLTGRIFEPFFTTKVVGQGTGLGLSTSLGIAEAHGGSLSLVPSAGSGAHFRLILPLAPAPQPALAASVV